MVAPERQRQGIGEVLFRTWDRNVGASLGLGLSESSHRLFRKLRWPEPGPIPCLVKPLTRRALKRPSWPEPVNQIVSALTLPFVKVIARSRPLRAEMAVVRRFAPEFTALWEKLAPVRVRRAARRGVSELEVRRRAACALRGRRVAARHGPSGLRRLPARAGATRPRRPWWIFSRTPTMRRG